MQHIWKVLLTSLLIFALAATACLAEDSEAQYQAYSYTTFSLRRTPSESDRGISVQKKTKILILEWDDAWCKAMLSGVLFDSSSLYLLLTYGPMLAICALAATPLGKRFYEKLGTRLGQRALTVVDCGGLACVLVMAAAYLVSGSYNPFLYFRF